MTVKKSSSLRKSINAHCKTCVYDPKAAGTWRAQVTLCPCTNCELFEVRPTTDKVPDSVYKCYGEEPSNKPSEKPKSVEVAPLFGEHQPLGMRESES